MAVAAAYEAAVHPRRPPPFTPPLVAGHAPAPVAYRATDGAGPAIARSGFSFDATRGTLDYDVRVSSLPPEDVYAIGLHLAREDGATGPMLRNLAGPAVTTARGSLRLDAAEREALLAGRVRLVVFTRDRPRGAVQGTLRPARP